MANIFVLAEHRRGELREVSIEMLMAAKTVAEGEVISVLFGHGVDEMATRLSGYCDKVLYVDDAAFADYNTEAYQIALSELVKAQSPELVMIANTGQGVDLAPALAVQLDTAFVSDVIALKKDGGNYTVTRTYYQGKLNADIVMKGAPAVCTVRESCFAYPAEGTQSGTVEKVASPLTAEVNARRFVEYLEAAVGDVDITQAEVLVSVGRGFKEPANMPLAEELAEVLGATISGSRAVVDAGWLPVDRQVGSSGKQVKPKVYIALGISGAFEHVAGMKGSKTIIAINKDPNAPIFSYATYGIADDLFKIVPKMIEEIKALKG